MINGVDIERKRHIEEKLAVCTYQSSIFFTLFLAVTCIASKFYQRRRRKFTKKKKKFRFTRNILFLLFARAHRQPEIFKLFTPFCNLLVVQNDVGTPYVVRWYVKHFYTPIFLRVPFQLVIVPGLKSHNENKILGQKRYKKPGLATLAQLSYYSQLIEALQSLSPSHISK